MPMVAAAIRRQLRPNRHRRLLLQSAISSLRFSSSSSNSGDNHEHETPPSQSQSQSSSSLSSYFQDVKASLRQTAPPPPPPRKPSFFDSNSNAGDAPARKLDYKYLRELFKPNILRQADPGSNSENASKTVPPSLKAISTSQSKQPEGPGKRSSFDDLRQSLNQKVLGSIGKDKKDVVSDETKTEFERMYSYGELGEKLRPEVKGTKKNWISFGELKEGLSKLRELEENERLRKLRELEEKENENRSGVAFGGMRERLYSLQISLNEKKTKTNAAERPDVLGQLGGTPRFMLSPPKEILVEKNFHPDHMSSSEKQKLELTKVRDKFKMSESDCGSIHDQEKISMTTDRKTWTLQEEDAIISILEEIVANGDRDDTGSFRIGTYSLIAVKMREKFENIAITASNVQNKMKRMKDKYSAAYDMLNTSGLGWDDTRKCVTIDDPQILTEYLKKHPNKNYTPNKPFPQYERLQIVFGNDRATGSMAQSVANDSKQMDVENDESETLGFSESLPTPPNVASASSSQTSARKRKRDVGTSATNTTMMIENSMEKASANIARLTDAIITGGDARDAMTGIGAVLVDLGFDNMQVIRASIYFGHNPNQLCIFSGLPDFFKVDFVKAILDL